MSCKMLIDGIVDYFPDAVVECRSVVRVSKVHPWSFADGLQSLEHLDTICAITVFHFITNAQRAP
jgi:hypothetical protein